MGALGKVGSPSRAFSCRPAEQHETIFLHSAHATIRIPHKGSHCFEQERRERSGVEQADVRDGLPISRIELQTSGAAPNDAFAFSAFSNRLTAQGDPFQTDA
jgi:hypothetical protein